MTDHIATILLAVLGSSVVSTFIVAFSGRRREAKQAEKLGAEARQIDRETESTGAEAYTLWMQSNIALQKQRREDIEYYTAEIDELKKDHARQTKAARGACDARIEELEKRVASIEQERVNLLIEVRQKEKQIDELQAQIDQLSHDFNGG